MSKSSSVFTLIVLGAFAGPAALTSTAAAARPATTSAADAPAPPREPPPPPATSVPPPPRAQPLEPPPVTWNAQAAPPVTIPSGQWVYTAQYGWLWMPWAEDYTQVVPDSALAYMFVFYPAFGWRWVVAPWVLGLGTAPRWGSLGLAHFAWYTHPRFAVPAPYRGPGWVRPTLGRTVRAGRVRR